MWQDIKWIWSRDGGQYPQDAAAPFDWRGIWLRVKCTICILLRRRGRDPFDWRLDHVPVAIGPMVTGQSYDGPYADWAEISVGLGWSHWRYYEYTNGI